ncbi:MAG: hypothetical protein ISS02_01170 [Candidatus Portnoybacteria bacterium]|nr:hypothetical protein [Candidatus Portnoybacteria bacterium]
MKKLQKTISIVTSIATTVSLSGIAMLMPMAALAVDVVDGDLIRNPAAEGMASLDIYIVKVVGEKKFKRLILSPHVFESYAHFDKNGNGDNWDDVMDVDQATMDAYTTTDLVREDGNDKVYRLYAAEGSDTGDKYWLNMTASDFTAVFDADAIYTINSTDTAGYTAGENVTDPSATFPPVGGQVSEGTLSITLAADTPAAGIAVESAARMPFTKVNLTATNGDVIVDSLVVERVGLANDASFSSIDIIDAGTNLPLNITSKTFNSLHQATFNDNFTVSNGTTKSIIIAANMAASLDSYAGEVPALSLAGVTLSGDATLSSSLPLTGNTQTINATITIGTATIQRGAYTNATSTTIQVGKEDYTYFSFQVQAGSAEDIQFSQIKVYQEGSASLGTDLIDVELYQEGTKIADGVISSSKYANFSFDPITLKKGQIAQFQVKGTVADGSGRTIILGVYKTTDLLVNGLTYGYNITPTYSSTGSSANSPVLSDNSFTISNGTLQVTRSSSIGAGNIGVANDQYLGAFTFTGKGEVIDISALSLTITTTGNPGNGSDSILNVELVDVNGNVVAGPTDPVRTTGIVAWTDTFSVPVGETTYRVRADLQTSADWVSDDTVVVSFTPSAMTATGDTTGNSITASPASAVTANTQTVKAASLTVTRNTLPSDANIIVGQSDLKLSSWSFDASDSGEDIRVTSIVFAAQAGGWAATNTNALTIYVDDVAQSPINDAVSGITATVGASSTFALDDPIIITKGNKVTVDLYGDKDTIASDDTENWGLTDDGGASIIAYGVSTGNTVTETLTEDDGPTLTSKPNGTLTVETSGNPTSAFVRTGSTGNIFSNVKLSADHEDLRLDQLVVYVTDGSYSFSNSAAGNYQDLTNVGIYDGTTLLAESSIPSTNKYTFNFNAGDLTIPKNGSKTLTIKADMATVDKTTDNAPGTNSADLILGFGGANGIKTTGMASNAEITGSTYEDFRSSSSSAMVLKTSIPTVTLPTSSNSLGAATSLSNGNVVVYAYKVTADADGGDVLLYRNTFVFATSGTDMTITNVYISDENGNTIKAAANPVSYNINGNTEYYYTATFNNPDFDVTGATTDEAIKIAAGTSKTFKVYATIAGASANENLTTFLVGDLASTSAAVNDENTASGFYPAPSGDLSSVRSNFIWSDNYKQNSLEGTGGNNATSTAQWYNGHLVPGLGNVVSTTSYVISY